MNPRRVDALSLGAAVVQRILPIRAPYLMVDRVEAFSPTPVPTLVAVRGVTANEPILAGHFVGAPIWPGAMILEGLSQSAGLLSALLLLRRGHEAAGRDPDEVLEALRTLDRRQRLVPEPRGASGDVALAALAALGAGPSPHLGMLAATEIRFRKPVFAGDRLEYTVRLTREFEQLWHFEVEACAANAVVADGTLVNAVLPSQRAIG